jgi:hypothetical protein
VIVLDTNVLSDVVRRQPTPVVLDWLARQTATRLFATTISEAEMLYGIALLPAGRRRAALESAVRDVFAVDFANRILPFDRAAAAAFATIAAERRRAGRPVAVPDAQLAAIARSRGAAVATRNVNDFVGCGIELINPWA